MLGSRVRVRGAMARPAALPALVGAASAQRSFEVCVSGPAHGVDRLCGPVETLSPRIEVHPMTHGVLDNLEEDSRRPPPRPSSG